jgi:hypothetical protein
MLLNGAGKTASTRAPPSLPDSVAELASRVEAEAKPVPAVYRQAVSRRPPAKAVAGSRAHAGRAARKKR